MQLRALRAYRRRAAAPERVSEADMRAAARAVRRRDVQAPNTGASQAYATSARRPRARLVLRRRDDHEARAAAPAASLEVHARAALRGAVVEAMRICERRAHEVIVTSACRLLHRRARQLRKRSLQRVRVRHGVAVHDAQVVQQQPQRGRAARGRVRRRPRVARPGPRAASVLVRRPLLAAYARHQHVARVVELQPLRQARHVAHVAQRPPLAHKPLQRRRRA